MPISLPNESGAFFHLILSGPSGSGKGTLMHRLLGDAPSLAMSVSHTTRRPRPNEVHGVDYHFVDNATFDRMAAKNDFAEWAEVHGERYGTALSQIDAVRTSGKRGIIFDIAVQGAATLRGKLENCYSVFVEPPSIEALEQRLRARGTDRPLSIQRRVNNAPEEMRRRTEFDFVVLNDDLEHAYRQLRRVLAIEAARTVLNCDDLDDLTRRLLDPTKA